VRIVHLYECTNVTIQFSDSETLIENFQIYWHGPGSKGNSLQVTYNFELSNTQLLTVNNLLLLLQRTIIRPGSDPNKCVAIPVDLIQAYAVPDVENDGTTMLAS